MDLGALCWTCWPLCFIFVHERGVRSKAGLSKVLETTEGSRLCSGERQLRSLIQGEAIKPLKIFFLKRGCCRLGVERVEPLQHAVYEDKLRFCIGTCSLPVRDQTCPGHICSAHKRGQDPTAQGTWRLTAKIWRMGF